MDIYGAQQTSIPGSLRPGGGGAPGPLRRDQSFQFGAGVSRFPSTGRELPGSLRLGGTFPGSLRLGRTNLRFQVPFDVDEATFVSRFPSTCNIRFQVPFDVGGGVIPGIHIRSNVCFDIVSSCFNNESVFSSRVTIPFHRPWERIRMIS